MTFLSANAMNRTRHLRDRRAIVLLIVLGMLSLFSVLIVTYVVFSSQMRQAAHGNSLRRERAVEKEPLMDAVMRQLVTGGGVRSAAFGQDLMGDLYGVDHVLARVSHHRSGGGYPAGLNLEPRGMLLQPLSSGQPATTLFKFPLHFSDWHNNGMPGDPYARSLRDEVVYPANVMDNGNLDVDDGSAAYQVRFRQRLRDRAIPDYRLSDTFTGRLLTFQEGPLQGNTFRIVRYFGTQPLSASPADRALAGCVVIDLAEAKSAKVTFAGDRRDLIGLAAANPNALVYAPGPDEQPGFVANQSDQLGEPLSDDVGFRLLINGAPFNGRGHNAGPKSDAGPTGVPLTRPNTADITQPFTIDLQFGPELLPNRRITGTIRELSEPDELYDAADFDNWFLAWQPADHRAVLPQLASELSTQLGIPIADALKAAPNIVPSYHRPEVINYLMNQPIKLNASDPGVRFADLSDNPSDRNRLYILIRRLRAATYRPLNFEHLFVSNAENASLAAADPLRKLLSDLNGDGVAFDGAPDFSGSNPVPVLNEPIAANGSSSFALLMDRTRLLALWMINGPWDVDNDGDLIPDSIWADFDLPTQVVGNGTVVKPMVAALIEDLDGRININMAGNYAQLTQRRFNGVNPSTYNNDAGYFAADNALKFFNRGGGIGPADINFSHLFDEYRPSNPANDVAPLFYSQTFLPINSVLRTRYGNLLQSRYGGNPWDYRSALNVASFPIAHPGQNVGAASYLNFSDPFSRILWQTRRHFHVPFGSVNQSVAGVPEQVDSPMGRPVDMFGRSTIRKDRGGNATMDEVGGFVTAPIPVANNVVTSELINQPYEFEIDEPVGDDRPFTATEFHSLIDRGGATALSERLVGLIGDAADSNEALARLLTFDSRSLDVVELPGGQSVVQFVMDRMSAAIRNNPQAVNTQIQRMLAVELRKGSKLNLNRPLNNGVTRNMPQPAFPQLDNDSNPVNNSSFVEAQSRMEANYLPLDLVGSELPRLTAGELLSRNLYCLMFRLIIDPAADPNSTSSELVPNFPYPQGFNADIPLRNRYVAKRLAQWAVNVVDMRDTDAIMTMFRYDPNPFNDAGFDLVVAEQHVVWGMERPEAELSETLAFHDRRAKRNLLTRMKPTDPSITPDGQSPRDEVPGWMMGDPEPDGDLDQFRIPEATAIVELRNVRDPFTTGRTIESYPAELYTLDNGVPKLDLGRIAGTGTQRSPVWRLAVGYTGNMPAVPALPSPDPQGYRRSTLWVNDALRFSNASYDPNMMPDPFDLYSVDPSDDPGNANGNWASRINQTASVESLPGNNAVVSLYDEDLDPNSASASQVRLDRFVWFANLAPNVTGGLDLVGNTNSGMRTDNVFYPADVLGTGVPALLAPGGHAVVMPRDETILGQTNLATAANNYSYSPSDQKFEVRFGGAGPLQGYSVRYFNAAAQAGNPRYPVDNSATYRVNNLLPIVAMALPPHQADVSAAATGNSVIAGWQQYYNNPNSDPVGIGFNISAPLPGIAYYEAPTHRINSDGASAYPLIDGYRDYTNAAGEHPDLPFDERDGAILKEMDWLSVGTKQDAASVFLQRLADPTSPWDATFNPYITVDSMTIDLTVFNGEEDMRQEIDPYGDGNMRLVDVHTPVYPQRIAFDTRRKIPDPSLDRPYSSLVINNPAANPSDLNNYRRVVFAHRSPLMSMQNMLRARPEAGGNAHFRHQLTSAWNNGNPLTTGGTENLHSGFRVDTNRQRFDSPAESYPQTLGFVNREMGEPAEARTAYAGSNGNDDGRYVGFPIAVSYNMPTWLDRPYQSPHEIMSVPATSASRLGREFGPGTAYDPVNNRETPSRFDHLLGFEAGIGAYEASDAANPVAGPAATVDASTSAGFESLTGKRAGFEQIFDLIDIGPLSFGQRRWFDPVQTVPAANGTATQNQMFGRVLQTLQPPFNYIDKHRTAGKVNLNTMPDYIRQGRGYPGQFPVTNPQFQRPFKAGTAPQTPGTSAGLMSGIASEPTNHRAGTSTDPFDSAVLYGNGSVYRALTSGISTAYDLDDVGGEPVTMGQPNGYHQTTDSRFGYGFKGFIQSRRGYGTSLLNPAASWSQVHFYNIDLDFRFPSRFAGAFMPQAGSLLPSVQKYLRHGTDDLARADLRRTHDMSLLRPHPDFDVRAMTSANRTNAVDSTSTQYTLNVETAPTTVALPALAYERNAANQTDPTSTAPVRDLRMPLAGTGLFERPQADLHKNFRHLDRDPFFRFKNTSQLAGMTTHHSNVFMIRFTVGFFHVDTATGAVGEEYLDPREGHVRTRGFYIVDRTIPVAYESSLRSTTAQSINALDTVIFSNVK